MSNVVPSNFWIDESHSTKRLDITAIGYSWDLVWDSEEFQTMMKVGDGRLDDIICQLLFCMIAERKAR